MNCFQTPPLPQLLELKSLLSEAEYCFNVQSFQIREKKQNKTEVLSPLQKIFMAWGIVPPFTGIYTAPISLAFSFENLESPMNETLALK